MYAEKVEAVLRAVTASRNTAADKHAAAVPLKDVKPTAAVVEVAPDHLPIADEDVKVAAVEEDSTAAATDDNHDDVIQQDSPISVAEVTRKSDNDAPQEDLKAAERLSVVRYETRVV